jgi:predicted ATP-dependent protease
MIKKTEATPPPSSSTGGVTFVPADLLRRTASLGALSFRTTADLPDLPELIGQQRAREALADAMDIRERGYNVFMLGPEGVGKRSVAAEVLRRRAAADGTPDDWCYVNNFDEPRRPRALRLPPGDGSRLRTAMREFVEELRAAIPALLDSEEFRSRAEQIDARYSSQQEQLFIALGHESAKDQIALIHTPAGFSFAPMRDGQVISPAQYEALPEQERAGMQEKLDRLQEQLQKTVRQAQALQKAKRNAIKDLSREMTLTVVGGLTDELESGFPSQPAVLAYFDTVQADVLENIDSFRHMADGESNPLAVAQDEDGTFRRYEVNLLVGGDAVARGAPVVFEDYPTFPNLFGRIENEARLGTLVTDFSLIQAGSLHRANGGYLVIDARKLLSQPFSWEGLKRVLSSGELRPETVGQSLGLVTTVALEPEPIPVSVKVVLTGSRLLHYLLLDLDPEYAELFKMAADFEDEMPWTPDHEGLYAHLVATLARQAALLPFDRPAVMRLVEQAAREAEDRERLSTQLEQLKDLLQAADLLARRAGLDHIGVDQVQGALDARARRSGRVREKILEAIVRGEIFIDTDGEVTGQINGLSVSQVGQSRFGHPTRITATTRLGEGEVIDIQREVEMGGPIHSKGVMILAAFLAARYAGDHPHCIAATLSFEQTYGEVEGDSASLAELAVLISSLADAPIRQCFAVTGSVNQHGRVQPIGGVNEKIEGFFDVCAARGLHGRHGVIIPAANLPHLMLSQRVVEAVSVGRFAIHAVDHVDQAFTLLTGLPAGEALGGGRFSEGSLNQRVAARLAQWSALRQAYANLGTRGRRKGEAATKAPPRNPRGT